MIFFGLLGILLSVDMFIYAQRGVLVIPERPALYSTTLMSGVLLTILDWTISYGQNRNMNRLVKEERR